MVPGPGATLGERPASPGPWFSGVIRAARNCCSTRPARRTGWPDERAPATAPPVASWRIDLEGCLANHANRGQGNGTGSVAGFNEARRESPGSQSSTSGWPGSGSLPWWKRCHPRTRPGCAGCSVNCCRRYGRRGCGAALMARSARSIDGKGRPNVDKESARARRSTPQAPPGWRPGANRRDHLWSRWTPTRLLTCFQ